MRRYVFFAFCSGLLYISTILPASAQLISIDSAAQNVSLKNAVAVYDKATIESGSFYNGLDYQFFAPSIKGNAYFPGKEFQQGSLLYNHINYYNIGLIYDIVRGLVIPKPFNNIFMFSLITDKVELFSIGTHNFKRIVADTTNNTLETGFYEVLNMGKTEVLLKRNTLIEAGTPPERYFSEHFTYYIKHNSSYYKVSSKGSVLSVLKDKKSDLQQHIKKLGLNFGDQKEQGIVALASYYDEITK
jgi:hypothetical protein